MKNQKMAARLGAEVIAFIETRKSLFLSSLCDDNKPYASYAPFAIGDDCLYILLSELAVHGVNLQKNPLASVLIIQDEDTAEQMFARVRVSYRVEAQLIVPASADWPLGIARLAQRHGQRIEQFSELPDFKLFRLLPQGGRFVKGFGKAYQLTGMSLNLKTAVTNLPRE